MAIKIGQIKKKEITYQDFLWSLVNEDQTLKKYFRRDNPLVKFELLDHSDSLNYSVAIGPYTAYGSAFIHDFLKSLPDSQIESRFKVSFHNVLRNLIMNVAHGEFKAIRDNVKFFNDDDTLNLDAVGYFIKCCTENFTDIELNYAETEQFHRWYFTSELAGPFGISIEKKFASDVMSSPKFGPHANQCTRDHITNLLVRSFVAVDTVKESAAKHRDSQNVKPETAKLMAQVRSSIGDLQVKREHVMNGLTV